MMSLWHHRAVCQISRQSRRKAVVLHRPREHCPPADRRAAREV